ncbi:ATP phosphoribosyltransferase regulatory subunit [Pelagibius litoralis]|uniref:ATP phosphoribosyltransferase regulatory subunit n=1 Tax=Pelagibius litoralis TaxID=374515 RepID=A0A967KGM3_9PROT|nr:ATP phosphoribosyltransferase regulatory subunit [Pelagibius litoralis]NIA70471.1 ATP phosphoribosyltransferase regulatory subunit [Pelagibius litoralis]
MTENAEKGLLPAGLQDVLAPLAAHESANVERLIACFQSHSYDRVKPPLLEFEEALLTGAGAALAGQTFRLMDPVSQRMMGLRADMTPQVARIATSRLKNAPRPLRLCYGGQVLQVRGSQLRPERQFAQAGVELIGPSEEASDAEVILLAIDSLTALGVAELSVDLNLPPLVGSLAADLGLAADQVLSLRQALDRKDSAAVARLAGAQAALFHALLQSAGPAEAALAALKKLALPGGAMLEVERLASVVDLIRAAAPQARLTIDPVEHRGFEYQTGISFILFAKGVRGELGRGGRYQATGPGGAQESSTGFTLYMDTVLRAIPAPQPQRRIFLPFGTPAAKARELRDAGWATLAGLTAGEGAESEAQRLGCSHLLRSDAIIEIKD